MKALRPRRIHWLLPILLGAAATASMASTDEFSDEPVASVPHPDWFKQSFLDLRDDLADAARAGKKGIVVYFGQEHCAYCKALMENDFGDPQIAGFTRENFDVIALNIRGDREVTDVAGKVLSEHGFALREKADLTPTLEFFDTQGRKIFRLRGYYPPIKFRAALRYVAGGHYNRERFRDYLARMEPSSRLMTVSADTQGIFSVPPFVLDRSNMAAQRPLVVVFEKGACPGCAFLHASIQHDSEVALLLRRFEAVRLDMWSDTPVITPDGQRIAAIDWAEQMGLFYAPTLVFFDTDGTEVFRIDSLVKLNRLRGILEYVASEGYLDEPDYQTWRVAHGIRGS